MSTDGDWLRLVRVLRFEKLLDSPTTNYRVSYAIAHIGTEIGKSPMCLAIHEFLPPFYLAQHGGEQDRGCPSHDFTKLSRWGNLGVVRGARVYDGQDNDDQRDGFIQLFMTVSARHSSCISYGRNVASTLLVLDSMQCESHSKTPKCLDVVIFVRLYKLGLSKVDSVSHATQGIFAM